MNNQELVVAMLSTLLFAVLWGPMVIRYLTRLKIGQMVRKEGPQTHLKKSGTPTMGGILFLVPICLVSLLLAGMDKKVIVAVLVTLTFGLIGFVDDYLKVVKRVSLGLKAREKLAGQVAATALLAWFMYRYYQDPAFVVFPFTGGGISLGLWYFPFLLVAALGTTNAVNFNDGVDGLLGGTGAITFLAYTFVALARGETGLALFSATLVGGCLGFLRFNFHPAQVFMGDVGSMALGGALVALAVLTKTELLIPVIGAIYVVEMLSVIIQVTFFRLTGGKRIFKMSPIHHHFELSGWSEERVVFTFWAFSALFALLGLWGFKAMS